MGEHVIERYIHHGHEVAVKTPFKGRHREICLCHDCAHLKPGAADNCTMAETLFRFCMEHGGVVVRLECPEFTEQHTSPETEG